MTANLPGTAKLPSFFHDECPGTVKGMEPPQQLSRQAIDEFKAIYRDEFGQELSDDEAQEIATRLLRFFGILVKPDDARE